MFFPNSFDTHHFAVFRWPGHSCHFWKSWVKFPKFLKYVVLGLIGNKIKFPEIFYLAASSSKVPNSSCWTPKLSSEPQSFLIFSYINPSSPSFLPFLLIPFSFQQPWQQHRPLSSFSHFFFSKTPSNRLQSKIHHRNHLPLLLRSPKPHFRTDLSLATPSLTVFGLIRGSRGNGSFPSLSMCINSPYGCVFHPWTLGWFGDFVA